MISKEILDEKGEGTADFEYEFEERELWNIGLNFNVIILQGLKQYKDRTFGIISEPEMFEAIDKMIKDFELLGENEFTGKDIYKEQKRAYKTLGEWIQALWY